MNQTPQVVTAEGTPGVRLLTELLRARWLLVGLPFVFALLAVVFARVRAEYAADASFLPQVAAADASRFASLAAQIGISMPGAGAGETVYFYASMLKSRSVLSDVVRTTYVVPTNEGADTLRGNLIELLRIEEDNPHSELLAAMSELDERIEVQTDIESGLIRFRVITPWAPLSEQVASRMLGLLNDYNLTRRQSQAAAERSFIEGRLNEARLSLQNAEAELRAFLDDNRTYQASPRLVFEQARLQRAVDLQQLVYSTLAQSYETARIDEVRNTPVLTLIDPPQGSARLAVNMVGAAFLGLVLGSMVALGVWLGRLYLRQQSLTHPTEFRDLASVARQVRSDLSPKAWMRRIRRPSVGAPERSEPRGP